MLRMFMKQPLVWYDDMTCLSAYHKSDTTQADAGMLKAGWNCIAFSEQEYGFLYSVVLNVGSN